MKYTKFTVFNYRGIEGPIEINIDKSRLIPIIGVNESGKTTILKAVFSFDYFNDDANTSIKHLDGTSNLYKAYPKPPLIVANIATTKQDLYDALTALKQHSEVKQSPKSADYLACIERYRHLIKRNYKGDLVIYRNLDTRKYSIHQLFDKHKNDFLMDAFVRELIKYLPYILYFDDFRDSIVDRIEIKKDANGNMDYWLQIIERLFKNAGEADDEIFSVFDLPTIDERRRNTILSKVNKRLYGALTKYWGNLHVDDEKILHIKVGYDTESDGSAPPKQRYYLKFDVVERISGVDYHFYVRDRSKGFYWFFNFVMKLEFNPKRLDDSNTIYLLDEPGSYLHASAQNRLCSKLKELSINNTVIYCTHSHYLLDPDVIPVNTIKVATKDAKQHKIELVSIHQHADSFGDRKSAFQPISDALQITPFVYDLNFENVLIVEGIYDYFCFEMFKKFLGVKDLQILPGTNADSLRYLISLMIASQTSYNVLWDNDPEGRSQYQKAKDFFEEVEAQKFKLLPLRDAGKDRRLEELFTPEDIDIVKSRLGIDNSNFRKIIVSLFYSPDRNLIIGSLSATTKRNFEAMFDSLRM